MANLTNRNITDYRPLTPKIALRLAAPHTWAASVCPALFGILYCWFRHYPLELGKACSLLLVCILMQSAVNTLNDYFDFIKGTDSAADNVEVSDAALVYEKIDPNAAKWLGIGFLAVAAVLGIGCCIGSGYAPLAVGVFGGVVILLYSGGPLPLSYLPIGEVFSGMTMGGLIPLGIAACGCGALDFAVLGYSLPLIIGIALIMMSNNGCDIEKDLRAGRRTLPVLLGRPATLRLYRLLLVVWLVLLVLCPLLLMGTAGLIGIPLTALLAGKTFCRLWKLQLEPTKRILQMKGVLAANIRGNGAYLLTAALALLPEVLHG